MRRIPTACLALLFAAGSVDAQQPPSEQVPQPTVRLIPASPLRLSGEVDSNSPVVWDWWDGRPEVYVLTSAAGRPNRASGEQIHRLGDTESMSFELWPTGGIWIESVIPDVDGTWYGYYHNENNATMCGDTLKAFTRIGAARSRDQGATWTDLGIILEMPDSTYACDTSNEFFVGGVGDFSALLDQDQRDVYFYFTQYGREAFDQGVAVARLTWADRDEPVGKLATWSQGVWLPGQPIENFGQVRWEYPTATRVHPASKPWHTGEQVDEFWGPSIHWNEALQQYAMMLNRSNDDAFTPEGVYVSFNGRLDEPAAWSTPVKIVEGGSWYPQVVGLDIQRGTDTWAAGTARFFMSGQSDFFIEFEPPVFETTRRPATLRK